MIASEMQECKTARARSRQRGSVVGSGMTEKEDCSTRQEQSEMLDSDRYSREKAGKA